ncbi:acyltransferase [Runella sp. SP2]|uniref:acyltransferase n=1 Tax=Runella sp. SP2 TaxID=2268026 RepID=UPI000F08CDDE|nr:acyltransferase [Runella sp. SP2]AYQ34318.1 acyltransferase [Runella sp. SP2]
MKKTIIALYSAFLAFKDYLFREWVMSIPFHVVRRFFIHQTVSKLGKKGFVMMKVEFRNGKNIEIGDGCFINKRTLLDGRGGRLVIGNHVDIAQEVNIWTLSHDPHDDFHRVWGKDVVIEDYAWIASRVTIMPGVRVGRGAVVAAGSIVTKDVAPMAMVAGVPAKVVGERKSGLKYRLDWEPWFK